MDRLLRSLALAFVLAAALVVAGVAKADIVALEDGRRFEGEVLSEADDADVRIDTMVGDLRATLEFPRDEVASVVEKEVPPDFFEPKVKVDERAADARKAAKDAALYLEVPIAGAFGKDVFAEAISRALAYANRYGLRHIVFTLDSAGGDLDEAIEVYRLLRAQRPRFYYHAIVRRCEGVALAVPVWCDTVRILPKGAIHGIAPGDGDDEEKIVWADVAARVVADTGRTGRQAEIVRALLDPDEALAAWRREDGVVEMGEAPPEGTPQDRLIFRKGSGERFGFDRDQAVSYGMPAFEGGAAELGPHLKIKGWAAESDYGAKVAARVSEEQKKKAGAKEAVYERAVKKNVTRRDATRHYIGESLKKAAEWDPSGGSYERYSSYWSTGWGWSGGSTAVHWTKESQKKWKNRTDACMYFLAKAYDGLKSMKKLDAEATKLGLEPTFPPGEAEAMMEDVKVKLAVLAAERDKKGD